MERVSLFVRDILLVILGEGRREVENDGTIRTIEVEGKKEWSIS